MNRLVESEASCAAKEERAFPRAAVRMVRVQGAEAVPGICNAVCERELSVRVNGVQLVTLLCSAVDLRELAYGFLYSERVLDSLASVRSFELDESALEARFELDVPVETPVCPTVSSGFGGRVLASGLPADIPLSVCDSGARGLRLAEEAVAAAGVMCAQAREYAATRGMHCSALFRDGRLIAIYEDVGRHNTFDKLAGHCLLCGLRPTGMLLATTGRVSGEMMRKALRLGVKGVVSLSGPTDVAIEAARRAGALLVGYAKNGGATVYAGLEEMPCGSRAVCETVAL